jgi:hypothetical protein
MDKYSLKEPTVGDVPGMFTGEVDTTSVTTQLLANCVLHNGKPIGVDGIKSLPLAKAIKFSKELILMAGLGDEKKE